jgi:hypothetical protein
MLRTPKKEVAAANNNRFYCLFDYILLFVRCHTDNDEFSIANGFNTIENATKIAE